VILPIFYRDFLTALVVWCSAVMELDQWVTGSMGSGFRKNAQNAKRTFEMLK